MKNLLLALFTIFLAYSIKAEDNLDQERMIQESYQVIAQSKQLRAEIEPSVPQRSVASLNVKDAEWIEYWQQVMDEPTEDPTYWLNKAN